MLKRKKEIAFKIKLEKRLRRQGRGKKSEKRLRNSGKQRIEWLSK